MSVEPPQRPIADDANPYRPVLLNDAHAQPKVVAGNIIASDATTETVRRAYLASIAGVLVLPPLVNLYSVYLLVTVDKAAYRQHRARMIATWLINSLTIPLSTLFWIGLA